MVALRRGALLLIGVQVFVRATAVALAVAVGPTKLSARLYTTGMLAFFACREGVRLYVERGGAVDVAWPAMAIGAALVAAFVDAPHGMLLHAAMFLEALAEPAFLRVTTAMRYETRAAVECAAAALRAATVYALVTTFALDVTAALVYAQLVYALSVFVCYRAAVPESTFCVGRTQWQATLSFAAALAVGVAVTKHAYAMGVVGLAIFFFASTTPPVFIAYWLWQLVLSEVEVAALGTADVNSLVVRVFVDPVVEVSRVAFARQRKAVRLLATVLKYAIAFGVLVVVFGWRFGAALDRHMLHEGDSLARSVYVLCVAIERSTGAFLQARGTARVLAGSCLVRTCALVGYGLLVGPAGVVVASCVRETLSIAYNAWVLAHVPAVSFRASTLGAVVAITALSHVAASAAVSLGGDGGGLRALAELAIGGVGLATSLAVIARREFNR